MLISVIKSELCCHKIKSHNRMSRKLEIPQKGRWQPTQCHAGLDCTQAVLLLLGGIATAQWFTFSLQLFPFYPEVYEIPHPSTTDLCPWSKDYRPGVHESLEDQ